MNKNMYNVLASGFKSGKVAIQTTDKNYTFDDIENISARYANLLSSFDLPIGTRVAVQVQKSVPALMLYLACLRAGYTYLPLNTAYTGSEVEYFLNDAQPDIVVCDPDNLNVLQPIANTAGVKHILTMGDDGSGSLEQMAQAYTFTYETKNVSTDSLAAILYTSGTTGRSKGAMLSHGNLAANATVLNSYWGWSSDDVLIHALPIFHVHGLFVAAQGALLAGAKMLWLPGLDIEKIINLLPQATLMMGVPTYYVRLLDSPKFTKDLCSNVRLFVSGSAPLLTETFNQFEHRIGQRILERYGMSETNMLTSNPYFANDGARIAGTVGRALPTVEVRIVDDIDNVLSVGEIGHVQVKGPNVFSGYWRMPEKTAQEFTQDGWFRTGDMGCIGGENIPDDYLSIVGRNKDLIISGGFNVYPKEIELLIDQFDGVVESAVIGVKHADFGEAVTAIIVAKTGIDEAALMKFLKSKLANFKVPKSIYVVDSLPRNTMGKVQKNVLRDKY